MRRLTHGVLVHATRGGTGGSGVVAQGEMVLVAAGRVLCGSQFESWSVIEIVEHCNT